MNHYANYARYFPLSRTLPSTRLVSSLLKILLKSRVRFCMEKNVASPDSCLKSSTCLFSASKNYRAIERTVCITPNSQSPRLHFKYQSQTQSVPKGKNFNRVCWQRVSSKRKSKR
jgi:hypothetical protein